VFYPSDPSALETKVRQPLETIEIQGSSRSRDRRLLETKVRRPLETKGPSDLGVVGSRDHRDPGIVGSRDLGAVGSSAARDHRDLGMVGSRDGRI
jgi:hypothetical protein